MTWRAIRLVAGREIRERLRSRAFVAVTALLAVLLAGAAALPAMLGSTDVDAIVGADDARPVTVGVLGDPADLTPAAAAALRSALGVDPDLVGVADAEAGAAALADGLLEFIVPPDGSRIDAAGGGGPFSSPVRPGLAEALGVAQALGGAGADAEPVEEALDAPPVPVEVVATGSGVDASTAAARFAVAYAGAVLLYFSLIFSANLTSTGVIQEKGSRVVELLLPAVPARHLMTGKVLGLGTVGTLQTIALVTPSALVLAATADDGLPSGVLASIVAVVVAFVLGFALYAGLTAGLSALVSGVEDAQVALFPLYAILVGAFFVTFPVLGSPSSPLAVVATFVPFTAPFVVPARIALVDLPLWQAGVAAAGVLATAVLLSQLAGVLFEGAILRGGARVRLRAAWRGGGE